MDFIDDQHAGGGALDATDNGWPQPTTVTPTTLSAHFNIDGAVSQTIAQAIRDATQTADLARQHEAASWLLICCPDIAEQVELPDLHIDTLSTLAAAYVVAANDVAGAHSSYAFG